VEIAMIIRREAPEEFPQIYHLVKRAFQTAQVTNGKEQDFVDELRSGGNYIPELALVAEEEGRLIGHIMLTKAFISHAEQQFETLFLGPVSVVREERNKVVGSRLIEESLTLAKAMGYTSVVLVGDPGYYNRFGFRTSREFGITHVQDIPEQYVMACELIPGALRDVSGTFDC
jgi:predicted N-acetyltransferase YhbS